jgi:hypothetical protein
MDSVRNALLKNPHPRLKKEVTSSRHQPYGKTADYIKYVEAADSEKLAKLIKTVALLLQTKVYLFWSRTTNGSETEKTKHIAQKEELLY